MAKMAKCLIARSVFRIGPSLDPNFFDNPKSDHSRAVLQYCDNVVVNPIVQRHEPIAIGLRSPVTDLIERIMCLEFASADIRAGRHASALVEVLREAPVLTHLNRPVEVGLAAGAGRGSGVRSSDVNAGSHGVDVAGGLRDARSRRAAAARVLSAQRGA
jgi:hypothetical protein